MPGLADAPTNERRRSHRFGYALPGVISWAIVIASVIGVVFFRRPWLAIAIVFLGYFLLRMAVHFTFFLVGEYESRRWAKRDWTAGEDIIGSAGFAPRDVWHIVVVPNYKEPVDLLERTLERLAVQHRASERLAVVLGMEEREEGSREKARALAAKFEGRIARIIISVHPSGVPGELAGKSSNENWAAREAYRVLIQQEGLPEERVTITSCDADSLLHPNYIAAISQLFATDERRYARFWQAPQYFYNNLWDVPFPIRYSMWLSHAAQLAELAMPFYTPLPISTYTLSLKMARECGFWDPSYIAEDWHEFLKCMFERHGDVDLVPVFLPTNSDATDGETFLKALKNRYDQVVRHAWGAEDVGYTLDRLLSGDSNRQGVFRFFQVLHDHVMRVAVWFMVMSVYVLRPYAAPEFASFRERIVLLDPGQPALPYLLAAGAIMMFSMLFIEFRRFPPPKSSSLFKVLPELVVMWMTVPLTGFYLAALPALHAQTRLMLGIQLSYRVTPKKARPEPVPEVL